MIICNHRKGKTKKTKKEKQKQQTEGGKTDDSISYNRGLCIATEIGFAIYNTYFL